MSLKNIIKKIIEVPVNFIFNLFPINENMIFFETGVGEVKDNPKFIYDYLKKHYNDKYKLRWAVRKGANTHGLENEEIVYKNTLKYYYILKTSKYWIRSHSIESIFKKRKDQRYIQLWHGPGATKKEGFDILEEKTTEVIPHAKEWEYYIATDEDSYNYIVTSTHTKAERVLLGNIRSDILVNNYDEEKRKKIRESLGIKENEKAILYAPTFREEDFNREKINLPIKKIAALKGYKFILRVHPEVKKRCDLSEYPKDIIDGNKYDDIFDLYIASDMLITDYSSVAIEYSILKKPIIFYMYDLEEYLVERDFYFNYLDNLGGPMVKTEDEVIDTVLNIDKIMEEMKDKVEKYYLKYNKFNDGKVSERFCKKLNEGFFDRRIID